MLRPSLCLVFRPLPVIRDGSLQHFRVDLQLVRSKRPIPAPLVSLIDLSSMVRTTAHDLDLSVPPYLRHALQGLLQCEDLPEKIRETIQSCLQGPDGYVLGEDDTRGHINDHDKDNDNDDTNDTNPVDEEDYISRQALSDIAKWARSDQGSASLARRSLGKQARTDLRVSATSINEYSFLRSVRLPHDFPAIWY